MSGQTFVRIDDEVLCGLIAGARRRLVFVAPGIRPPVAQAIADAMDVVPASAIHLVLDVDAEVCRLGYGDRDFKGMELLQHAAAAHTLTVNHHPGIRIGLLVADDTTLVYSPTPELIEAESCHPDKPNGIVMQNEIPPSLADACGIGERGFARAEVGLDPIDKQKMAEVREDLKNRPPKEFNVARVERVFSSLLQYVELKIEDYKLTSRSILLDSKLFGVRDPEVISRLSNRYHLFAQSDSLSVEIPNFDNDGNPLTDKPKIKFGPLSVDRERKRIKDQYVMDAGKFGSLILRRNLPAFKAEIKKLEAKTKAYRSAIQKLISNRTEEIVNELLDALKEQLKTSPPEHWQSRFLGDELTDADVERLFRADMESQVKRVRTDFDPKVFLAFKEVTYETFKDEDFRKAIEDRFGKQAIDDILREHDAAPENERDVDDEDEGEGGLFPGE